MKLPRTALAMCQSKAARQQSEIARLTQKLEQVTREKLELLSELNRLRKEGHEET